MQSLVFRILIIVPTVFFVFTGCKSTPDAAPDTAAPPPEKTVVEPEPTKPDPAGLESLSEEDIEAARKALQRANLMGANQYFPVEYRGLAGDLNEAVAQGESDPDGARSALKTLIVDANALYDKTLAARRDEYVAKYWRADEALLRIEAQRFAPDEYRGVQNLALDARALYEAGDLVAAKAMADETLGTQSRLYYNLDENIRYVAILRRDTESYLGDAEDNEAFIYAVEELEEANAAYFDAIAAYQDYELERSAQIFAGAKRSAVMAARTSVVRKRQAEADALMVQTQERLESASNLQVLNPDGSIGTARPWEGEEYLSGNPLIDHSRDLDAVEIEEPQLRALDEDVDGETDMAPVDVPIEDSGVQVNADEQDADYLLLAQDLWEQGVSARNDGRFDLAEDYFRRAQAYIDVYESNAVSRTYTVVYRDVATDCLWRIAEMDGIFANPFLWPKIWRANRRIVQNPDLIYPGQVLAIPPK